MLVCKLVLFLSLCHILVCGTYGNKANAFFRKDYTYLQATESFYKIHTIQRNWQDARKRCALEGATLYYPEDQAESEAVVELWKKTQPLFAWIWVGISDLLSKADFETIDGKPVVDVYHVWGQGEPNDRDGVEDCVIQRKDATLNDDRCPNKYPFICKKSLFTLEWNALCELPDRSYLYEHTMGKCYKFHLTPKNWTEAYSVCSGEQSYLAIINSQKEADHLVKLTADAPKDNIRGDYLSGAVHLGFHNRDKDGWQTIRRMKLEESGYAVWGNRQPDGGDKEPCGTMFYNGRLNDLSCSTRCFFICEHDIGSLESAIDDRFAD